MSKRTKKSKISSIIAEELNKAQGLSTSSPVTARGTLTVPTPPQLVNHVVLLLDDSGSMRECYGEAVRQLNANIANIRAQAALSGQRTTVSLYLFGGSGRVTRHYFQQPVERLQELSPYNFASGRCTPLIDAVGDAIADASSFGAHNPLDPNSSYLVICLTDGGENGSTRHGSRHDTARFVSLIRQAQDTDRWTFAFLVPPGQRSAVTGLGVPAGNVTEWANTVEGARAGGEAVMRSMNNYYTQRASGKKSTEKFFTDLSTLSKAEVEHTLVDLSGQFKASTVDKEMDIKAYAEERTGRPYVIGSLYYALTKKETIQASKDVLLMEKNKKTVYGGPQARALLKLPAGKEAEVTPGNHANWDVYVKSTSVNRKLVRGTKVLIDTTKATSDKETWDSAAAKAAADAKLAAMNQPGPRP